MDSGTAHPNAHALPRLTLLVAIAVVAVVAGAWYVVWASQDLAMPVLTPAAGLGTPALAAFFLLMVVMMVAMMFPSALPMILAYRGFTRLEHGAPTKPADDVATLLFLLPYFVVWGAFSVLALVGLVALGLAGSMAAPVAGASSVVVLAAGGYQFTRPKETCLAECESPMSFVMRHWRAGRTGAVRMGARHALYCIGCCWLFMLVLFVVGTMSLLWMGIVSIAIFAEKVGSGRLPVARIIGIVLLVFGGLLAAQALGIG